MSPAPSYRRRRPHSNLNKNELKASRNESEKKNRASAGTLQQRFPQINALKVEMRMESPQGAILEESGHTIGPDDSILADVPCPGGCSGGSFKLTEAIEAILNSGQESRDGMGICQASSYGDPHVPCGVKFYYRVTVR